MFEGRIKELGDKLSAAFTERAKHYFAQAKTAENPSMLNNMNVVGAVLGEVANVIKKVVSEDNQ
jgi:hypothetical protein